MKTDPAPSAALAAEIARIETIIRTPRSRDLSKSDAPAPRAIRPRNAATIILVDGPAGDERILMGRRSRAMKFMPGALVFPGGAVDAADAATPFASDLDGAQLAQIAANLRGRTSPRAARALAVAAVRELAEETGVLLGMVGEANAQRLPAMFSDRGLLPALSGMALLARAITPPGPPRRFDTWFFVARAGAIGHAPERGFHANGELEEVQWISPREAILADTREITRVMLVELMGRLAHDPALTPGHPAPFYRTVRRHFERSLL